MDDRSQANAPLTLMGEAMRTHWRLWLFPTVGCTVLAIAFAIVFPGAWEATQTLHVRDENIGKSVTPGRFESYEAMKTTQETIYAVVKNRHVLRKVLEEVGPISEGAGRWPSNEDVDDLMSGVSLNAPNGAVFGQTEVIHLNVRGKTPERAMKMAEILCREMDQRVRLLRQDRSESLEREMQQAVNLSRSELNRSTSQLKKLEIEIGPDLAELRNLNQLTASNDATLQQSLGQTRQQLQAIQQQQSTIETRQQYLASIQQDPNSIETVPTSVLQAHPSLGQLKQGLVESQLRAAQVMSAYDPTHPKSERATLEVAQIRQRLKQQVSVAMQEAEFDLQASQQEESKLESIEQALSERIQRLTRFRVEYNRLADEVEQRKQDLAQVSSQLSEIQAGIHAAENSSIISAIDGPTVGTRPVGPGKRVIALGGLACGLAIGIGLVVLAMPAQPSVGATLAAAHHESVSATFGASHRELDQSTSPDIASSESNANRPIASRTSDAGPANKATLEPPSLVTEAENEVASENGNVTVSEPNFSGSFEPQQEEMPQPFSHPHQVSHPRKDQTSAAGVVPQRRSERESAVSVDDRQDEQVSTHDEPGNSTAVESTATDSAARIAPAPQQVEVEAISRPAASANSTAREQKPTPLARQEVNEQFGLSAVEPDPATLKRIAELKRKWQSEQEDATPGRKELAGVAAAAPTQWAGHADDGAPLQPRRTPQARSEPSNRQELASEGDNLLQQLQRLREQMRESES